MQFKYLLSIIVLAVANITAIFSQTVNETDLMSCLESGIRNHPLQANFALMDQTLETQHKAAEAAAYPGINWNTSAKIQSESISLEFENPMLPSFEVPIYSFTSALELNYIIYDGGYKNQLKSTQSASVRTQKQQLTVELEQIKTQIVQLYLGVLFLDEKGKILQLNLARIRDTRQLLENLQKHGVADQSMILQWEVKELELQNQIEANQKDRMAQIRHLEAVARISLSEDANLKVPDLNGQLMDHQILRKELELLEAQKYQLEEQSGLLETTAKPRMFVFGTAGVGYPNPLNFFDDQLSIYAIGGIGVNWKFYDWGKRKNEQQVIKLQQSMISNQKHFLEDVYSQQDEKYQILLEKYASLIEQQTEIHQKMEEIALAQKKKMENGTLLPVEYLRSLNDVMETRLKLSQYQLELIKTKAEFMIVKGKL